MSPVEVIHAYRQIYRQALRAVCHSHPASTTVRNLLRRSFRTKDTHFDERATRRTIWFLKYAAKECGIEHKIVKNIVLVQYWRESLERKSAPSWKSLVEDNVHVKPTEVVHHYCHYEKTIDMLNKTMGLCLPLR